MSSFGVDLDLPACRAHLSRHRPGGRRLPRRGDDRPLVGDRDVLVLVERPRAQARRLDLLPGPSERAPLQRWGLGVGRRCVLPMGAALPRRVLGSAAPTPRRTRHARLRVAQRRARPRARAAEALRRDLLGPRRARARARVRGDHGAQPAPDGRGPLPEGRPLRPGGTRHRGDGAARRGGPDRLLLGARPLLGTAATGTPEATLRRGRFTGGELRRGGLLLLRGRAR